MKAPEALAGPRKPISAEDFYSEEFTDEVVEHVCDSMNADYQKVVAGAVAYTMAYLRLRKALK